MQCVVCDCAHHRQLRKRVRQLPRVTSWKRTNFGALLPLVIAVSFSLWAGSFTENTVRLDWVCPSSMTSRLVLSGPVSSTEFRFHCCMPYAPHSDSVCVCLFVVHAQAILQDFRAFWNHAEANWKISTALPQEQLQSLRTLTALRA